MKQDIEQIKFYLQRMRQDEENILENHKMNIQLIDLCLARIEKNYNSNIQSVGSNGNGSSREEQW
jgi:hypothetical protein